MTCRACLTVVVAGADSSVRPTVVVVVTVPTLDEFRADGLAGGENCVVRSLPLLLLRLLVAHVAPRWVPSCVVAPIALAPSSGVLLLHLRGRVWCLEWLLLNSVLHLLLLHACVRQLLL